MPTAGCGRRPGPNRCHRARHCPDAAVRPVNPGARPDDPADPEPGRRYPSPSKSPDGERGAEPSRNGSGSILDAGAAWRPRSGCRPSTRPAAEPCEDRDVAGAGRARDEVDPVTGGRADHELVGAIAVQVSGGERRSEASLDRGAPATIARVSTRARDEESRFGLPYRISTLPSLPSWPTSSPVHADRQVRVPVAIEVTRLERRSRTRRRARACRGGCPATTAGRRAP